MSDEDDNKSNDTSRVIEGHQEEPEDEEMATTTTSLSDRVNVQQILESMTNAFNNSMNKKSDSPEKKNNVDKIDTTDNTDNEKTQNYPKKIDNTKLAAENKKSSDCNVNDEVDKPDEIILKDTTTDKNKDNELLGKQESKKDGNIPRIVLTFRTIDETTDDGRKTKISSCGSNLSLVPDELGHCDKIGGVSVKIEHSEEQVKKSANKQSSENKEINSKKNSQGKDINETKDSLLLDADNNKKEDCEKGLKIKNNGAIEDSNKMKNEETNNDAVKPDDGNNGEALVTRKRKYKCRTRESLVNAPEPKRSARRSSKEAFSVLESAMARKEKSYYTEESKRKYTKPCKPKKVSNTKEKESSKQSKSTRGEINSDSNTTLNNSTTSNSPEPTPEKSKKSNSDFDGMPKLSPMVKKSQITDSKTTNDLLNNEDHSLDNKPFLRPFTGKNKRERVRSRGGYVARKLTKSESQFEDPPSPAAEAGKTNDYPEEANVVTKRTRRSLVPSPSPAEGQASKPESTAISTESYEEQLICLCQVRSQLYVTITGTGTPLYCTAIDSIDNRLIGCCNEVDSNDVAMRRPSTRVPFIILCRSHKERLVRHNCCPSCGLFCTQGKFLQCTNGHQYHLDCDTIINKKSVCPHCASDCQKHTVLITMSGTRKPVYIPTRKQFSKLPSAKMSLPGKGDNTVLAEKPPSLLVKPDDIKIPEPSLNSDKSERFTVMSLYTAVKNEDLEKLVNVLASGYSANHIFREYGQRTVLHLAAQRGHLACVHILVQAGCQLDVMDKSQLTPLMLAATNGNIDVVRYLVRVGADVTLKGQDGMTALHMAAKSGHLEACKIIISECKIPKTLVDSIDDGGWTSLIWACEFCHVDVARFLIDKKCDPLIRDSEQNIALHWSAYSGSSEITEMLLNEDCDVNSVNVHGDTPLHIAARQDKYAVSVLLLARGAKISEVNTAGETAIDCCSKPDGDTMAALRLNARINELTDSSSMEKTIKILTNDISRGKERNPIQCVNGFDSEDKPTDFLYITDNCFTSNINVDRTITSLQSCHCEDNCTSEKCLCGNISLRCWYDEVGRLIPEFNYADPPMLFECNQACDCNRITCNNRVVQHGVTQRFQLFRTKGKGWGLKTLRSILKGTYVCEYVGEIISDSEADHREDDSYLFDLDNRDGETYCIDARRYGNIARFINHSCAPNLLPVRVFVEHQDLHFPRIAFFANRDIDADEELGFDYGEKFWIIKCKSFTCTCGALNCRYSEKVIQVTLDNYRQKIQLEENLATQRHI